MKDDAEEEDVAEDEEAFVEEACRMPRAAAVRTCMIGREACQEASRNSNQTSPSAQVAFVEAAYLVAAQDEDEEQDEDCP